MKYGEMSVTARPEGTLGSMIRYLLDANALSEPIKPMPNRTVTDRIDAHRNEVATAAPVWSELLFGCFRLPESARRSIIEDYLLNIVQTTVTILPFDRRAAEWHASERARLGGIGLTPPFVDSQIAAVAFVNNLTLVTANTSDFSNFDSLRVEDWSRPI